MAQDTKAVVKRAFEADWQLTRIPALADGDVVEELQLKRALQVVWTDLKGVFKHYAGVSNTTFGMSLLAFDHFARRCKLFPGVPISERKRVRLLVGWLRVARVADFAGLCLGSGADS